MSSKKFQNITIDMYSLIFVHASFKTRRFMKIWVTNTNTNKTKLKECSHKWQ